MSMSEEIEVDANEAKRIKALGEPLHCDKSCAQYLFCEFPKSCRVRVRDERQRKREARICVNEFGNR
jgi:hypothetical protein